MLMVHCMHIISHKNVKRGFEGMASSSDREDDSGEYNNGKDDGAGEKESDT